MMGAKWRVGDGKSISVYNDSWIPELPSGGVVSSFSGLGRDIGVAELINQATGSWHVNLIDIFFLEALQILASLFPYGHHNNQIFSTGLWKKMASTRKNRAIRFYVMRQGVKKLRVQTVMEARVCDMVFGNLRYRVRLNIFCGRHAPLVYQLKQTC